MPLGSAPLLSKRTAEKRPPGPAAATISTRVVGLLREATGRGPTNAKAIISSDLVVVTLSDHLTTAERQVVTQGRGDLVARTRAVLHDGIRAEATAIVEELTERQVTAYLTAENYEPDLAILVFYLGPAAGTLQ